MTRLRRDRGEGTLYYSADRDRWVGQLDLGRDHTGRRKRPMVIAKTRAEARAKLREEAKRGATAA